MVLKEAEKKIHSFHDDLSVIESVSEISDSESAKNENIQKNSPGFKLFMTEAHSDSAPYPVKKYETDSEKSVVIRNENGGVKTHIDFSEKSDSSDQSIKNVKKSNKFEMLELGI